MVQIDNDFWLDLKVEKIRAAIYMGGAYMGDKYWERPSIENLNGSSLIDMVPDFKATTKTDDPWIVLHYAPPKEVWKSSNANRWQLKAEIEFSCRLGIIIKRFDVDFCLDDYNMKSLRESHV